MTDYRIIDDVLSEEDLNPLEEYLMGGGCQWNYNDLITEKEDVEFPICMFTHLFYNYDNNNHIFMASQQLHLVRPILSFLNPTAVKRIKGNMYLNQNQFTYHGVHTDLPISHKSALFYVNDNNGYTILEDETKVESKRNRILLFDGSRPHRSTNCTDAWRRININFNYF
jgi:hypothetical protein